MKTTNTSSELRGNDKQFGFLSKLKIGIWLDGVFNLPSEIKKLLAENKEKT